MEEDFISKMTLETFDAQEEHKSSAQSDEDLEFYFNQKRIEKVSDTIPGFNPKEMLKFLDLNQVATFQGDYLAAIQCFRLKVGDEYLDFPQNWSFFNDIYVQTSANPSLKLLILLDEKCEPELVEVINLIGYDFKKLLFFFSENKVYMAGFSNAQLGIWHQVQENDLSFDYRQAA